MPETLVILPTFNERENLTPLIEMLVDLPLELGVLIVDDNSPDGTGQVADQLSAKFQERVTVIHRAGKLGLGTAYLAGFRFGLANGADRLITMDADFSHHPRYISSLVAANRDSFDLTIGSRYVPGGGTQDFPIERRVLSSGANSFARIMLGLRAHDVTAGFRCYRREVLETLPLDTIFSNGYSFLVEMLFLVQRAGFKIGEVPIIFEDRKHGASKISEREIIKAVYTVLRLYWRRVFGRDPRFLLRRDAARRRKSL